MCVCVCVCVCVSWDTLSHRINEPSAAAAPIDIRHANGGETTGALLSRHIALSLLITRSFCEYRTCRVPHYGMHARMDTLALCRYDRHPGPPPMPLI